MSRQSEGNMMHTGTFAFYTMPIMSVPMVMTSGTICVPLFHLRVSHWGTTIFGRMTVSFVRVWMVMVMSVGVGLFSGMMFRLTGATLGTISCLLTGTY